MSPRATNNNQHAEAKFRMAISRLLKPIARFALARGFKLQELIDCLKSACLEVATEQLEFQGEKVNISRLSVLTGLQRKEIRRTRKTDDSPIGNPNLLNRILGCWQSDARFLDDSGKPRLLECEGAESEFCDLVAAVSVDTNPYTVLFGLEQAGAVIRVGKRAKLTKSIYDASKNALEGLDLLGQDSARLHAAVTENIFDKPAEPNLHITTLYDNVCVEDLEHIRKWLLDKGTEFHEAAREFLKKYDKDSNPRLYKKTGGATVSLCAFSFIQGGNCREK